MNAKNKPLFDFLKSLKKINFSFGSDADKDWLIICYFTFFAFLAVIIWSGYIFFSTNINESLALDPNASSLNLIDKKGLSLLIEKYDKKRINFNIISEKKPNVVDPSE